MTDYFISKLPSGHAVKDITKAAAAASLRGDTTVTAAPANTVPLLRRQCAAVVWLRSDVCTADNLEKLALADRTYLAYYLLKLCGLLDGGSSKVQSRRTPDHLKLHPGDGGSSPGDGGSSPGDGGGGPAPGGGPSSSGGASSGGSSAAGGGGGAARGSLPATLLSSAAVSTPNLLSRADLALLLNGAGVPYDAGDKNFHSCTTLSGPPSNSGSQSTFAPCWTQPLR
jgi:hypothetical protein